MDKETKQTKGIEMPSRENITIAEQAVKEFWKYAEYRGERPHIFLSIDYLGDPTWTICSIGNERLVGNDPTKLLEDLFPTEEQRTQREQERKKAELMACENRANELRKELNELCEK